LFKNSQPFRKNYQKTLGGKIFWLKLYIQYTVAPNVLQHSRRDTKLQFDDRYCWHLVSIILSTVLVQYDCATFANFWGTGQKPGKCMAPKTCTLQCFVIWCIWNQINEISFQKVMVSVAFRLYQYQPVWELVLYQLVR